MPRLRSSRSAASLAIPASTTRGPLTSRWDRRSAELASALAEHEAYEATATGDFTVDGYEGIRIELVMPSDLDYTTCQLDQFWVWDEPFYAGQPARWDLWILDLDGNDGH